MGSRNCRTPLFENGDSLLQYLPESQQELQRRFSTLTVSADSEFSESDRLKKTLRGHTSLTKRPERFSLIAFRQASSGSISQQLVMSIFRMRQSEQCLKQTVKMSRFEEIIAP
jgi:hypothetical protein